MTPDTQARLAQLNAEFYEQFGDDFGDSRPRLNPGVRRVIDLIEPDGLVIDVGCGDGKVGRRLPGRRYLGLDASAALLARALALTHEMVPQPGVEQISLAALPGWIAQGSALGFCRLDLLTQDVEQVPAGCADWVLALAVLHHIPGRQRRQDLVRHWASWLKPGGRLAISCWQPQRSPRSDRLRHDWSEAGLAAEALEDNDWLLGWQRRGRSGLRYVHVLTPGELDALLAGVGLTVVERFQDDGHRRDQADYVLARVD